MKTPNKKEITLSNKKQSNTSKSNKCSNCLKTISSSKKVLHERFCKENIKKCPICNEPIPKEEFEEHLISHRTFSSTKSKKTKSSSTKKLLLCRYCGLSLSEDELNDHEYMCGSKSQQCLLCKKFIPKKFYENHLNNECEGFQRTKKKNTTTSSKYSSSYSGSCTSKKYDNKSVSFYKNKKINYSSVRRKMLSMDKEISKKENRITKEKSNELYDNNITKNLMEYLEFGKSSNLLNQKRNR